MRICSCFSSATELLYALGAGRSIVGRSERCDYPRSVLRKPVIVASRVASDRLTSGGIHRAVQALRRRRAHHYRFDVPLLARLRPDLIVTQTLCNVCAASHPEVLEAVRRLPQAPRLVSVNAGRFADIVPAVQTLGRAVGRERQARRLCDRLRREIAAVQRRVARVRARPRVWCAEWLDPLMAAGHWVPEMVAMAGGDDGLGRAGQDSAPLPWERIRRYDPEVIVVMPCSFSMARSLREAPALLARLPGWQDVSAVRAGRVVAVETSFFHRPGPRLVEGLRLFAALLHPERFPAPSPARVRRLR